jgi:3',5'-nucleoside bisphosphate phosphatase
MSHAEVELVLGFIEARDECKICKFLNSPFECLRVTLFLMTYFFKDYIMMIDLHCHTTASDGIFTPKDLVKKACYEKIRTIAIADHDTVDGVDEAVAEGKKCGLHVIPAIEFSIDYPHGDFHLLGYYPDCHDEGFLSGIAKIRESRERRIPKIVERLRAAGLDITESEVIDESGGGSLGKPHVARVLVRRKFASSIEDAFDRFLGPGKAGDVPKEKVTAVQGLQMIIAAEGIPVCAHPVSLELSDSDLAALFGKYIPLGLAGLECFSNMHTDDQVTRYCAIADSLSLLITGGSDFHGDKNETIGYYGGKRIVPSICAENLESFRAGRS